MESLPNTVAETLSVSWGSLMKDEMVVMQPFWSLTDNVFNPLFNPVNVLSDT